MSWLLEPEKWSALGRRLIQIGEFGLDTETYDQPDKTSPQHRAKVHCWSIGVLTRTKSPRGYNVATGVVLPVEALDNLEIREALANPRVKKWAHNAPHDYHSISNRGVEIAGMEDTLQWARVTVPGMRNYGLKQMEHWALGKDDRPEFRDVVSYRGIAVRSTWRKAKRCSCGKDSCRAKGTSEWFDAETGLWKYHEKEEYRIETIHERELVLEYPVTAFVPGAVLQPLEWLPKKRKDGSMTPRPGWWKGVPIDRLSAWEAYSAADAISGIELVSWLRTRPKRPVPFPW